MGILHIQDDEKNLMKKALLDLDLSWSIGGNVIHLECKKCNG